MRLSVVASFCSWCLLSGSLFSQDPVIVDQRDFTDSINACGPASVLNCLKFSRDELKTVYEDLLGANEGVKMRYFVDRYLKLRDSVVYPDQNRWGVHGVATADLLTGINELLEDHSIAPLSGQYLDRGEQESSIDFVHRVHRMFQESLRNEVFPILSLRSFVVRHRADNDHQPAWETGLHHNVVVTAVSEFQANSGFLLTALDPWEGREISVFLYREGAQSFRALKGVEPTGEWLDGRKFLLAAAPEAVTLQPRNLEWSQRFIIVANFLIGDF